MRRLLAIGWVLLIASAALVGAQPAAGAPGLFDLQGDFDRVQFHITVTENGTGEWTFRYERTLENTSEREQFATFAERFRPNETGMFRDFRRQATALVKHGSQSTGRNMSATAFERNATVERRLNTLGVVEMGFTWSGFAVTEGDRVVVGDVFQGGLYLGASQSLVIAAGDGLRFQSVEPLGTSSEPTLEDSETVTWRGERTFADNHPRVVFVGTDAASGGAPDVATTSRPSASHSPSAAGETPAEAGSRWVVPALSGIAVLVGVGLTILWYRSGAVAESGGEPEEAPADLAPGDEAVMDDRERVDALLRDRGGRMRQSDIVEETGWSKSKVSMVLSEMEEEGTITKLRVGRENLISLPGHEPEAARSPHEED